MPWKYHGNTIISSVKVTLGEKRKIVKHKASRSYVIPDWLRRLNKFYKLNTDFRRFWVSKSEVELSLRRVPQTALIIIQVKKHWTKEPLQIMRLNYSKPVLDLTLFHYTGTLCFRNSLLGADRVVKNKPLLWFLPS